MDCANRAHDDLCLRTLKAISSLSKVKGCSFQTHLLNGTFYVKFICDNRNYHASGACMSVCTSLSEDEEIAFRKSYVGPRFEQHKWRILRSTCSSRPPSAVCQRLWRKTSPWTLLGRTRLGRTHLIHDVALPSYGYPDYGNKCFVCSLDSEWGTHPLCGRDECWLCLDAFVSFSCAMWCLKQILPRDIADCIGGQMIAVCCAMCVRA